jgi:hypothetical protein
MTLIPRISLLSDLNIDLDRLVPHPNRAELAIYSAHDRTHATFVDTADRFQAQDQADTAADLGHVFIAGPQPVQVVESVQPAHVAVRFPGH